MCDVMDGAGVISGAAGGSDETVMMQQASQDDIFQSQYFTGNRFQTLSEGVGYTMNGGGSDVDWREQRRKRKRYETGSVDLETFCKMSSDEKLIALFTKLSTVESKQNNLSSVMSPVYEKVDILEDCVNIHARKLKMLSYRSLDLEARSRRNNLIFRGLADVPGEKCAGMIIDFLMEEMQVEISQSDIVRAHRLGSLRRSRNMYQVTRRPIIVAFKDYSLTERIMANAKYLRGSTFRVEKDFPTEIAQARKNLWSKLKDEKSKHPNCKVTLVYPAKLIKNNRVIADEFPDWHKVLRTSRVQGFESEESGDENSSEINRGQDSMTRGKQVFRPWQPRERPSDNMDYQGDRESDSDASVIGPTQPNISQQTSKKLFTKQRMSANRLNELKMTDKMKLNRDNKFKNKVPFTKSRNNGSNPSQIDSNHNQRNESKRRSSSLPDTARGRSSSRSNKQQVTRGQQDQPISGAQPEHMIHDVTTGVPINEHSNITTSQDTDNTQDSTQK